MGNYITKICSNGDAIKCGDGGCDGDMQGLTKREVDKLIRDEPHTIHHVEKYLIRNNEIWDTVDYWIRGVYESEFDPANKKPTPKKKKATPKETLFEIDWW
jgi:hypothetical protein